MMSWLPYLLDLELLFPFRDIATCTRFGVLNLGRSSRICHLDVGHDAFEVCGVLLGGVQLGVAGCDVLCEIDISREGVVRLVGK